MSEKIEKTTRPSLPLGRNNFIAMAISGALIVLGFILMLGSANDGTTFNADIFSTRRIVVGPMICFLGFVLMAVAIILRPEHLSFLSKNKK